MVSPTWLWILVIILSWLLLRIRAQTEFKDAVSIGYWMETCKIENMYPHFMKVLSLGKLHLVTQKIVNMKLHCHHQVKQNFKTPIISQYHCRFVYRWRGHQHKGVGPAAALLLRSWVRIPPGAWIFVCCECRVLSGRGLCDELITRPEESYRLWCVAVCDLETSRICTPYIYDIRSLRVKEHNRWLSHLFYAEKIF